MYEYGRNSYLFSNLCSNFEKVEIRKRFFAGSDLQNVKLMARLFYVKPFKKLFSD